MKNNFPNRGGRVIIRRRAAPGSWSFPGSALHRGRGLIEMSELLKAVESPANENVPQLRPGDMVKVYIRIKEGNSERTQEFKGMVIRLRNSGNNANFTVRRIASNGVGVERT